MSAPPQPAGNTPDPSVPPTAVGPGSPTQPPPQPPQPPPPVYPAYSYATPPPANPPPKRSRNSLALILLGVVALGGIAFAALAAAGIFSHSTPTQTITSAATARPTTARPAATAPAAPTGHPATASPPPSAAGTASAAGATTSPRAAAGTPSAAGAITSCGGGLSVGPNTSCSFAQNVEQAYDQSSGGNVLVTAYSPATGLTYTIDCSGGSPHLCTGGTTHNASVYFTSGPTYPTPKATPPPQPSATTAGEFASFAGTWGAHEESLVIGNSGSGHLSYADLTACPKCSMASAPEGTMEFVLTSVANGEGSGSVTASSDPRNWAVGAPVEVSLRAASPGQFLDVVIGGKQLTNFCNNTSQGQCGA